MCLQLRSRYKLRRVLVARLQFVNELLSTFLTFLALLLFRSSQFQRPLFAFLSLCLFELFEVLRILFLTFVVKTDSFRILLFVFGYAGLGFWYIDVVDQVKR